MAWVVFIQFLRWWIITFIRIVYVTMYMSFCLSFMRASIWAPFIIELWHLQEWSFTFCSLSHVIYVLLVSIYEYLLVCKFYLRVFCVYILGLYGLSNWYSRKLYWAVYILVGDNFVDVYCTVDIKCIFVCCLWVIYIYIYIYILSTSRL